MPKRVDVRNPRSEYMLKEFEGIVKGELHLPDGDAYGFVSELNALQHDILAVLEVPLNYYDYRYLFDSSWKFLLNFELIENYNKKSKIALFQRAKLKL